MHAEFFPKDSIHEDEECGWSHEAPEVLASIGLALLEKILEDTDFDVGEKTQVQKVRWLNSFGASMRRSWDVCNNA